MLAKIDFADEKRLALMLAMDVPVSVISEKLGLAAKTINAYERDEDFSRIVKLYREEFQRDQLEVKMRENPDMLTYLVKRKLFTLSDILDKDLEFIHEEIHNHKSVCEARDFINSLNSLSNLANVIRQLLRDISIVANDTERVNLEKVKTTGETERSGAITPDMISKIRGIVRSELKAGE
jgi:hypothetical protein